ncbi:MAG: hypothetical protein CM1200mP2_45330 [Planctomycetaceae bacterium]|nr:MAG: hypothetical protein CM1200mP2_45330 [Planctomycetaceae bacterium]
MGAHLQPRRHRGFWSNEHVHYDLGDRVQHASMQDMALIGPDTSWSPTSSAGVAGGWREFRSPSGRSRKNRGLVDRSPGQLEMNQKRPIFLRTIAFFPPTADQCEGRHATGESSLGPTP